jgi:hypothetical protein
MAEETGGFEGLGKVIPSIYYDLIARVCAGVPFLAVLLWDERTAFGDPTWSKLALLFGAGYVAGLVLTPLSLPWVPVHVLLRRKLKMPLNLDTGASLTDDIASRNRDAGETLAKMQAEAVLCENLFGAFLLLIILNAAVAVPLITKCSVLCRILILAGLGVCSLHRIIAYVVRENRLYEIYVKGQQGATEQSVATTPAIR